MFRELAKFIIKNSKAIVIIWVVLLLASLPFLYMVLTDDGKILAYDITTMEGADSESYIGMEIIADEHYFVSEDTDLVFVIECDNTVSPEKGIDGFITGLRDKLDEKYGLDENAVSALATFEKDNQKISLVAIYLPTTVSMSDTIPWLRNVAKDIIHNDGDPLLINKTYLTGGSALTYDISTGASEDVMRIDPFTVLLVLILIGLFFRSLVSSAVPPITIGFAYSLAMIVVVGVAAVSDIYYITTTMMLVSMLGAGCDYCIFIMARYKEERLKGKNKEDALIEAVTWAGESVATSGLCVIIGFGVMSFCSFSLIKTMGLVLAAGIIFALLAALTLIPAVINLTGDRIFFPSKMKDFQKNGKATKGWHGKMSKVGQNYFRNSAKFSIEHAGAIIAGAIILTVPLAAITLTQEESFDMISTMPNAESRQGLDEIMSCSIGGMIMPTYILMDVGDYGGQDFVTFGDEETLEIEGKPIKIRALTWTNQEDVDEFTSQTTFIPNLLSPGDSIIPKEGSIGFEFIVWDAIHSGSTGTDPSQIKIKHTAVMASVVSWASLKEKYEMTDEQGIGLLKQINPDVAEICSKIVDTYTPGEEVDSRIDYVINTIFFNTISQKYNGHQYIRWTILMQTQPMSDESIEYIKAIKNIINTYDGEDKLPYEKAYVTGSPATVADISDTVKSEFSIIEILVVILILVLLFIVMKSYFTPVRSVVTIIMSILWTLGITHLLFGGLMGQPIVWLIPIVLFVICLGLGMDYDILLTTRIREYVTKGMTNDEAIEAAVEHSGAIITICGLIMGGAFLTLTLSTSPMLQQFGFALGFAILIDALVIRTYVVPATMHALGDWNWVGPAFLHRKKKEWTKADDEPEEELPDVGFADEDYSEKPRKKSASKKK